MSWTRLRLEQLECMDQQLRPVHSLVGVRLQASLFLDRAHPQEPLQPTKVRGLLNISFVSKGRSIFYALPRPPPPNKDYGFSNRGVRIFFFREADQNWTRQTFQKCLQKINPPDFVFQTAPAKIWGFGFLLSLGNKKWNVPNNHLSNGSLTIKSENRGNKIFIKHSFLLDQKLTDFNRPLLSCIPVNNKSLYSLQSVVFVEGRWRSISIILC